jgi:hypothetical protein
MAVTSLMPALPRHRRIGALIVPDVDQPVIRLEDESAAHRRARARSAAQACAIHEP